MTKKLKNTKSYEGSIATVKGHSSKIESILITKNALKNVPELLHEHFQTSNIFLIADENTMMAAGDELNGVLEEHGFKTTTHIFPGFPQLKAKVEVVQSFIDHLQSSGGIPVAVGSGVINDLVRYAAYQIERPYLSIATAASMDGYASSGAPLSQKGFKHTIPCAPPKVIVADLDVLANAPHEMSGWGYGDLAGKITAGADWMIADTLNIEAIDDQAWSLVQNNLRIWLDTPTRVAQGDITAIKLIFTGLVNTGIAMELHQSSRPASGADHHIAHMWEMDGLQFSGKPVSHGTCVALGTLTVLSLYEWLIDKEKIDLDVGKTIRNRKPLSDLEREIRHRFPSSTMAEKVLVETREKYATEDDFGKRIIEIQTSWPRLRQRLIEQLIPFEAMKSRLAQAGLVIDPITVGINRRYHRETTIGARLIRRRYTILDFLDDIGMLNEAVDDIFSKEGRWA